MLKQGISMVVATRNRSGTRIENFLQSLKNQKFSMPFEIILVDSYSEKQHQQSIAEIARQYQILLIRITQSHTWNKPVALNLGIKNAQYCYCLLTDIDMIFADNFLDEVYQQLTTKQQIVIHCQSHDLQLDAINLFPNVVKDYRQLLTYTELRSKNGNGACFATDTSWLYKVRGLDERLILWGAMDRDLSFRAEWDGFEVIWLENTSFLHQWHPKKSQIWSTNPDIREQWDKNHLLVHHYEKSWLEGRPLDDQIVRNPEKWGEIEHTVVVHE